MISVCLYTLVNRFIKHRHFPRVYPWSINERFIARIFRSHGEFIPHECIISFFARKLLIINQLFWGCKEIVWEGIAGVFSRNVHWCSKSLSDAELHRLLFKNSEFAWTFPAEQIKSNLRGNEPVFVHPESQESGGRFSECLAIQNNQRVHRHRRFFVLYRFVFRWSH